MKKPLSNLLDNGFFSRLLYCKAIIRSFESAPRQRKRKKMRSKLKPRQQLEDEKVAIRRLFLCEMSRRSLFRDGSFHALRVRSANIFPFGIVGRTSCRRVSAGNRRGLSTLLCDQASPAPPPFGRCASVPSAAVREAYRTNKILARGVLSIFDSIHAVKSK